MSIFLIIFIFAGCANTNLGMNDRQQTIFQGTVIGVAAGASTGALLGQLIGKDTKSTLLGAGIGAALGGLAGASYGTHIADLKAKYANDEEYLIACIKVAREANKQAEAYNDKLRSEISNLKKEIHQLVRKYNRGEIVQADLLNKKKELERQLAQLEVNRKAIHYQIEKFKQARAQAQKANARTIASLDREIYKLEKAAQELEAEANTLASISQAIKV